MASHSASSLIARGRGRLSAAWAALRGGAATPASAPIVETQREAGWWDLLPFTVHQIPFGDGLTTAASGFDPFVDTRTRLVLDRCGGALGGRTLVDLGCLEGGFSLAFAEAGASHVVGIEARAISVERCELARRLRGTEHVEFVVADIKDELVRREPFDIVFAAGILYHIGDPATMLRTVRSSCREFALIDTHVSDPDAPSHGCSDMAELQSGGQAYRGRWFPEYDADASAGDRDGYLWAAWSDSDAFWPTEEELVRMLHDAGFTTVEKVDMTIGDRRLRWRVDQRNRVVYVANV